MKPNQLGPQMIPEAGLQPAIHFLFPPKIIWMWNESGADITAGDVVCIDLSNTDYGIGGSVKTKTAAAADNPLIVGVCKTTTRHYADLNLPGWCEVQVAGAFGDFSSTGTAASGVNVDGATTAGQALIGDAATAGRLIVGAAYAATSRIVAISLEADVANKARCLLLNPAGY